MNILEKTKEGYKEGFADGERSMLINIKDAVREIELSNIPVKKFISMLEFLESQFEK